MTELAKQNRDTLHKTGVLKIEGIGYIDIVPTAPKNTNLGKLRRKLKPRLVVSNGFREWLNMGKKLSTVKLRERLANKSK